MRSIGGGRVRYVGIEWLECPERKDVLGECTRPGTIEILWGETVTEREDVACGDILKVADGATLSPGATLLERRGFERTVRAPLPPGVESTVYWSEDPDHEWLDEITGLSSTGFKPGDQELRLMLRDASGALQWSSVVPRGTTPFAASGEVVRRGQLLARLPSLYWRDTMFGGVADLRHFLDARSPDARSIASLAPTDARVAAVDSKYIRLTTRTGRELRRRRPPGRHVNVQAGDWVRAGDELVPGQRSHHHLLRLWGEERLAEHLLDELELATSSTGLDVPRVYWELCIRKMLGWRRVLMPGDTGFRRHQIVERETFERAQNETVARGGNPATFAPALRGLAAMARDARIPRRRIPLPSRA